VVVLGAALGVGHELLDGVAQVGLDERQRLLLQPALGGDVGQEAVDALQVSAQACDVVGHQYRPLNRRGMPFAAARFCAAASSTVKCRLWASGSSNAAGYASDQTTFPGGGCGPCRAHSRSNSASS